MVFTGGNVKVMVVRRFLSGIFNLLNAFGRFKVGLIRLILPCGARVEKGGFSLVVPIFARSISLICTWCDGVILLRKEMAGIYPHMVQFAGLELLRQGPCALTV
jgi:hypothetical protein